MVVGPAHLAPNSSGTRTTGGSVARVGVVALLGFALSSCRASPNETRVLKQQLSPGVAALVGNDAIWLSSIQRIAAAQGISETLARDQAIGDALLARAARQSLRKSRITAVERSLLARSLLEDFLAAARRKGTATDAELDQLLRERWFELDRSAAARTTHAVVLVTSAAQEARARAVAETLATEARAAKDVEDFMRRAREAPTQGLEIRVEKLPFIVADGRAFHQDKLQVPAAENNTFDPDFARAAIALSVPGQSSPVVKTRFGLHVIYLEEYLPPRRLSPDQKREQLSEEVMSRRAKNLQSESMAVLEKTQPVAVVRSADELTARVIFHP